ncbi:hypothetical protein Dimus_036800 [Dionaea muscipula]
MANKAMSSHDMVHRARNKASVVVTGGGGWCKASATVVDDETGRGQLRVMVVLDGDEASSMGRWDSVPCGRRLWMANKAMSSRDGGAPGSAAAGVVVTCVVGDGSSFSSRDSRWVACPPLLLRGGQRPSLVVRFFLHAVVQASATVVDDETGRE